MSTLSFFFFQAEDGIRDVAVTGVQTCALPISQLGSCGMVINGRPHGPERATTVCQLHMRTFPDGAELWIEPWRARAFPVIKDLVVDRAAFDRLIQAGGFITEIGRASCRERV